MAPFALAAQNAHAHALIGDDLDETLPALLTAVLLAVAWLAYVVGQRKLPAALHARLLFHATAVLTLIALLGPIDDWAKDSSAMHMVQHMLLMVVIAPLAVLSRPLPQWRAAVGQRGARMLAWPLRATRLIMTVTLMHGVAIWFWHAPKPYMLAVENPWWHAFEHLCFLLSAGLFWWATLRAPPALRGRAMLALLFTLMHTGLLGALLTFSNVALYREANDLQDQQLAGLIMWVPGGLAYLAAAIWCGNRWFRQLVRRSDLA